MDMAGLQEYMMLKRLKGEHSDNDSEPDISQDIGGSVVLEPKTPNFNKVKLRT